MCSTRKSPLNGVSLRVVALFARTHCTGKEANPFTNARLEKECKDIAKKYWKGAKIEEFDALSPEYSIKIERN